MLSLLLADGALDSSFSQISLGEHESMLLSPCITPIAVTLATLYMSPEELRGKETA